MDDLRSTLPAEAIVVRDVTVPATAWGSRLLEVYQPRTAMHSASLAIGQGLAMGAGAALAARLQKSHRRVFVLLSDAECNEGSVWEAAMFAAHHGLGNLVAIVDLNRQQALGYTADVIALDPLEDRWRAFGWDVHSVDGHDPEILAGTIAGLSAKSPHVLIAHTTFGKGVSFMESQIRWHYLPMNDEQYAVALGEVG